jgi:hypothetical protein
MPLVFGCATKHKESPGGCPKLRGLSAAGWDIEDQRQRNLGAPGKQKMSDSMTADERRLLEMLAGSEDGSIDPLLT